MCDSCWNTARSVARTHTHFTRPAYDGRKVIMIIKRTNIGLISLCFLGLFALYKGVNSPQIMFGAATIIFAFVFAFAFAVLYRKNKTASVTDFVISAIMAFMFVWVFVPNRMPRYQAEGAKRHRAQNQK